jgi:hypothetical protein
MFNPGHRREIATTLASAFGTLHSTLERLAQLLPAAERSLTAEEVAAVVAFSEQATQVGVMALKLVERILNTTDTITQGN